MIKFFRRIRKDLLNKGKTTKYFKYALGEIVLVVIGILIALSINNWNQNRKNKIQESQILKDLQQEFHTNLEELNQKMSIRNDVLKSCSILLNYIDNPKKELAQNDIAIHLGRSIGNPTFDPALGVTNELINSGKLYLISDNSLRFSLTSWTSNIDKLREAEAIVLEFGQDNYLPYLIENYPYRNVINKSYIDINFNKKYRLSDYKSKINIFNSKKAFDLTLLLNSDLEDYLANIIFWTDLANTQSEGVKTSIQNIQKLIKKGLEEN